ncbi:MAG: DUF3150 domain-containing protein [Alteromonadaceae bacterium]|nr:DUF3150 domain-containing protein [Alteromonadaceae bacterium]
MEQNDFLTQFKGNLILFGVSGSCGEATVKGARTVVNGVEIDSSLVKGTTIQWFPSAELKFVNKYLTRVSRKVKEIGLLLHKGVALISDDKMEDFRNWLKDQQVEFQAEVEALALRFDEVVEDHVKANPDVAELIEGHITNKVKDGAHSDPLQALAGWMGSFRFAAFPPIPFMTFEEEQEDLPALATMSLWDDVAMQSKLLHDNSFLGEEACSQRAITAVRKIYTKLESMSFLHDGIINVVSFFDEAFDDMPKKGEVSGVKFAQVKKLLALCSEAETLRSIAAGKVDAQTALGAVVEEETPTGEENWFDEDDDVITPTPMSQQQTPPSQAKKPLPASEMQPEFVWDDDDNW